MIRKGAHYSTQSKWYSFGAPNHQKLASDEVNSQVTSKQYLSGWSLNEGRGPYSFVFITPTHASKKAISRTFSLSLSSLCLSENPSIFSNAHIKNQARTTPTACDLANPPKNLKWVCRFGAENPKKRWNWCNCRENLSREVWELSYFNVRIWRSGFWSTQKEISSGWGKEVHKLWNLEEGPCALFYTWFFLLSLWSCPSQPLYQRL